MWPIANFSEWQLLVCALQVHFYYCHKRNDFQPFSLKRSIGSLEVVFQVSLISYFQPCMWTGINAGWRLRTEAMVGTRAWGWRRKLPYSQFLCFGVTDGPGLLQIPAPRWQFADCVIPAHVSVFATDNWFPVFIAQPIYNSLSHFHTNSPTIQVKRMEACLVIQAAHRCKS